MSILLLPPGGQTTSSGMVVLNGQPTSPSLPGILDLPQPGRTSSAGFFISTGPSQGGSDAPVVSSISPPFGATGIENTFTITGSGFTGATAVSIASSFAVVSDTVITGSTSINLSAANVDVVITNSAGSGTLTAGFTYLPATGWTTALFGDSGVSASLGLVSTWSDLSGAGNDFTQSSSGKPTWTAPSGGDRGFLTFDGSTTQLIGTNTLQEVFAADLTAFSVYAVAWQTSAGNATNPEALNGSMLADYDTSMADNYGYYCLGGAAIGLFGHTDTWAANIYDALTDSTAIAGDDSLDYSQIQLVVHSLDASVGGGTQYISINSGDTYENDNGSNGAINIGGSLNSLQLGVAGFGSTTSYAGNIYAVFIWNRQLTTDEDTVVKNMCKNLYSIRNW